MQSTSAKTSSRVSVQLVLPLHTHKLQTSNAIDKGTHERTESNRNATRGPGGDKNTDSHYSEKANYNHYLEKANYNHY